jgi:hypothetical protein
MERESSARRKAKKVAKGVFGALAFAGNIAPAVGFENKPPKAETILLQKKAEATGPGGKPEIPEEVMGEEGNL